MGLELHALWKFLCLTLLWIPEKFIISWSLWLRLPKIFGPHPCHHVLAPLSLSCHWRKREVQHLSLMSRITKTLIQSQGECQRLYSRFRKLERDHILTNWNHMLDIYPHSKNFVKLLNSLAILCLLLFPLFCSFPPKFLYDFLYFYS